MRLSLRFAGATVARRDLGGPLLIRPEGMRVLQDSELGTVLELAEGASEAPDLLVGEVPLVWWNQAKRSLEVSFLQVPPPPPFTSGDIVEMWSRIVESPLRDLPPIATQGRALGQGRPAGAWFRPEAVPRARFACRQILGNWPQLESLATIWSPLDMAGAPEDLRETDRRSGKRLGTTGLGGRPIPDRVARRSRSAVPWRSARLAIACRSLAEALSEQSVAGGEADDMKRPFILVAEQAGGVRAVDPPVSSWPPLAQSTLSAVLEALVALEAVGEGSDRVPLSDVWRLYESWLATAVVGALLPLLGPGEELSEGGSWGWEWKPGSGVVRVRAQPTIGAIPDSALTGHPEGLLSVLGDLRPDALITVCDPAGKQAVLCLEAKRRTAKTAMKASGVGEAAAKYVWGIRSGADPDTPLASVIVASSAQVEAMHDEARARTTSCFLLPSQGREDFDSLVRGKVEELLHAVGAS